MIRFILLIVCVKNVFPEKSKIFHNYYHNTETENLRFKKRRFLLRKCDFYDIAQSPWTDDGRIYASRRLGMSGQRPHLCEILTPPWRQM